MTIWLLAVVFMAYATTLTPIACALNSQLRSHSPATDQRSAAPAYTGKLAENNILDSLPHPQPVHASRFPSVPSYDFHLNSESTDIR